MIFSRLFRSYFLLFMIVCCFCFSTTQGVTRGLVNQRNSCYMNAAIQCLIHVKPFVENILNNQERFNENPATSELVDFLIQMKTPGQAPFSPAGFYAQNFIGTKFGQEDSAEFLTDFLDKVVTADGEHVSTIKNIFNYP